MDRISQYADVVQQVITTHKQFAEQAGVQHYETVFDTVQHRYLLIEVGWNKDERSYTNVIHVDIIDGKLWIQRDATEDGIVDALLDANVPKEHIVLGYRSPFIRQFTEFAVA
ncbi:XisI protein [Fibrella sp. WM1]|uniref:XisI protein n=1 Tax=Fibrella musci TaxID=3242485 RepID=UPI00352263A3